MSDLLPRNATPQERAMANTIARISDVPTPLRSLWSPATCPADFLPWLAWALSVDDWDANWTEAQKRAAIAASVDVHRVKGTIGALKRALQAIGYEVEVNENTGEAYVFRIAVNVAQYGGLTNEIGAALDEARRIAISAKNVRSYLGGVDATINNDVRGQIVVLGASVDGVTTEVQPAESTPIPRGACVELTESEFQAFLNGGAWSITCAHYHSESGIYAGGSSWSAVGNGSGMLSGYQSGPTHVIPGGSFTFPITQTYTDSQGQITTSIVQQTISFGMSVTFAEEPEHFCARVAMSAGQSGITWLASSPTASNTNNAQTGVKFFGKTLAAVPEWYWSPYSPQALSQTYENGIKTIMIAEFYPA